MRESTPPPAAKSKRTASSMLIITPSDFDTICRFCLQRSEKDAELTPIFDNVRVKADRLPGNLMESTASSLSDKCAMIRDLTGLEILQFDGLPLGICNSCTIQLVSSHRFREQCIVSTERLIGLKLCSADVKTAIDTEEETHNESCRDDAPQHSSYDDDDEIISSKTSSQRRIERIVHAKVIDDNGVKNKQMVTKKITKRRTRIKSAYKMESSNSASSTDSEMDVDGQKTPEIPVVLQKPKSRAGRKPLGYKPGPKPVKEVKKEQCDVCGFISGTLKVHMMTHENKDRYECDVCGMKFAVRTSIQSHLYAHFNIRPIKCPHCPAKFITPGYLRRHLPTHTKQHAYPCQMCDRKFERADGLKRHMLTHQQNRAHQCRFCPKAFISSKGLRNHIGIHTGERPFKCGLCPMRFKFSGTSSNHRRAVHLVDGKYKCEKCGLAVDSFPVFKVHLLSCRLDAWWEKEQGGNGPGDEVDDVE